MAVFLLDNSIFLVPKFPLLGQSFLQRSFDQAFVNIVSSFDDALGQ